MNPKETLAAIPWPKDVPIYTKPGKTGMGDPWWEAMARQLKCVPVNGWHSNAEKRCRFAAGNSLGVNVSFDLFKKQKVDHPADEPHRLEDEYCRTRLQMRTLLVEPEQVRCVTLRCEAMPKKDMSRPDVLVRDEWFRRIHDTAIACFHHSGVSIRWIPAGPEHEEKWIPANVCATSCMTAYRIADYRDLVDLGRCIQEAKMTPCQLGVTLHLDVWHDRKGDKRNQYPYSPPFAHQFGLNLAPHWKHIHDVQLWDPCLGHPDGAEAGVDCLSAFFTGLAVGLKEVTS